MNLLKKQVSTNCYKCIVILLMDDNALFLLFLVTERGSKSRQHSMHQWGACDTVRPDGVPVKALTEGYILWKNRSTCQTCRNFNQKMYRQSSDRT